MTFPGSLGNNGSDQNWTLIDLAATIGGSKKLTETPQDSIDSDEIEKRVENLGLTSIKKLYERQFDHPVSGEQVRKAFEKMELKLTKASRDVKTSRFGRYSEEKTLNAINFLELLSLFSAQQAAMDILAHRGDFQIEDTGFIHMSERSETYVEKNVFNAIKELEFLAKNTGATKKDVAPHLRRLSGLLDKIYSNNLSPLQQKALAKPMENAKKVLKQSFK